MDPRTYKILLLTDVARYDSEILENMTRVTQYQYRERRVKI